MLSPFKRFIFGIKPKQYTFVAQGVPVYLKDETNVTKEENLQKGEPAIITAFKDYQLQKAQPALS